MREELYAHIVAIYDEELERTGDEDMALDEACRRFGEPGSLTPELQGSVLRIERVLARIDMLVCRRKHETLPRHALRMVGTCLLGYLVFTAVTLTTAHLLAVAGVGPSTGNLAVNLALRLRMLASLGVFFLVNTGVFTLIGYAMRSQLEAGLLRPRSIVAAGGFCVLAALTAFFTGWGLLLTMSGIDAATSLALLPRWLLLAGLTPLGFAAVCRLAAIEVVRSRPWTSLEIDE